MITFKRADGTSEAARKAEAGRRPLGRRLGDVAEVISIVLWMVLTIAGLVLLLNDRPETYMIVPDDPATGSAAARPPVDHDPEPRMWNARVRIVSVNSDTIKVDVLSRRDTAQVSTPVASAPAWVAELQPGATVWVTVDTGEFDPSDLLIVEWGSGGRRPLAEPWARRLPEGRVEAIRTELGQRVNYDVTDYIADLIDNGELLHVLRYDGWGFPDRIELVDGTVLTQLPDNTWDALVQAPAGPGES